MYGCLDDSYKGHLLDMSQVIQSTVSLQNQPYKHWNIFTTDAQNSLLHVSALLGYHHQGIFTVFKVVLSKWSVFCSTGTQLHMYYNLNQNTGATTHKILIYVQLCHCAAYSGPFRKYDFKCNEESLMMATVECRNMQKEILCVYYE